MSVEYNVGPECIDNLKQSFTIIGFKKVGPSSYEYVSDRGWSEKLMIKAVPEEEGFVIDWERYD